MQRKNVQTTRGKKQRTGFLLKLGVPTLVALGVIWAFLGTLGILLFIITPGLVLKMIVVLIIFSLGFVVLFAFLKKEASTGLFIMEYQWLLIKRGRRQNIFINPFKTHTEKFKVYNGHTAIEKMKQYQMRKVNTFKQINFSKINKKGNR